MGLIDWIKSSSLVTHLESRRYTKRRNVSEFASRSARYYQAHYKDGVYSTPSTKSGSLKRQSSYRRHMTSESYNAT
ncbi:hypothetical protein DSO57_1005028 [Entomophthora muscae]|uniref:Uncharacterized protein n=1 Tax=Entomophthora muscae TaxID=34485 RepID=A0ACC2TJ06_9FUNG|nr:hypothetical protein DSO57_1005028 [Entomophthora muscae]